MKTFKEYFLDASSFSNQTCYMPAGAEVLSVRFNNGMLFAVALVDPLEPMTTLHTFKICNLNENIYSDTVKYIGNFVTDLGVNYLIEILIDFNEF